MSIRFTTYKVTVSYQYMSYLCYREIHLGFAVIVLLSTPNTSFYYILLLIITKICLSYKF